MLHVKEEELIVLGGYVVIAAAVSLWDIRERRIPNVLVGSGFVLAAIDAIFIGRDVAACLLGAAVGFAVFAAIRLLSKGHLGMGDVKYSAFLGAMCGTRGWTVAIFVASVTGLAAALVLLSLDRRFARWKIPFGPFLSLGGAVALLGEHFHWLPLLLGSDG